MDDAELVQALRDGDEAAFAALVDELSPALLRAGADARAQPGGRRGGRPGHLDRRDQGDRPVRGPLVAAHVDLPDPAQHGAHPRGAREADVAVLVLPAAGGGGPRRAGGRRGPLPGPRRCPPGWWARPPAEWEGAEAQLENNEVRDALLEAIKELPPRQRDVIVLRDLQGYSAEEARNVLGLTETNQRVLLHRAQLEGPRRARVVLRRRGGGMSARYSARPMSCQNSSSWSPTTSRGGSPRAEARALPGPPGPCDGCQAYVEQMRIDAARARAHPRGDRSRPRPATSSSAYSREFGAPPSEHRLTSRETACRSWSFPAQPAREFAAASLGDAVTGDRSDRVDASAGAARRITASVVDGSGRVSDRSRRRPAARRRIVSPVRRRARSSELVAGCRRSGACRRRRPVARTVRGCPGVEPGRRCRRRPPLTADVRRGSVCRVIRVVARSVAHRQAIPACRRPSTAVSSRRPCRATEQLEACRLRSSRRVADDELRVDAALRQSHLDSVPTGVRPARRALGIGRRHRAALRRSGPEHVDGPRGRRLGDLAGSPRWRANSLKRSA